MFGSISLHQKTKQQIQFDILKMPEVCWPTLPSNEAVIDNQGEELKPAKYLTNTIEINEPIMDLDIFSSWKKLLRVTAYVYRFIKLIAKRKQLIFAGKIEIPVLEEIQRAERDWICHAQKGVNLKSNALKILIPFLDENGIQRVYGRLKMSTIFEYDRIHPIILPGDSRVSKLILENIHKQLFHPGHLRVISESRKRFWIVGCRLLAKQIGYNCVICRRWRNKACEQIMSNLPPSRLAIESAPFQDCAVDYIGPLAMKYGRRARTKAYAAVFSCLTTRCVHLRVGYGYKH